MSEKAVVNPLEQFVLLAKSAKGAAAVALIRQVSVSGQHEAKLCEHLFWIWKYISRD